MFKSNLHGTVTSFNELLMTTNAAPDEITLQLMAGWLQVDAEQIPTTKFDPYTVTVDPKYGGLGHTGKFTLIWGKTT
jgi:hypothetical protein